MPSVLTWERLNCTCHVVGTQEPSGILRQIQHVRKLADYCSILSLIKFYRQLLICTLKKQFSLACSGVQRTNRFASHYVHKVLIWIKLCVTVPESILPPPATEDPSRDYLALLKVSISQGKLRVAFPHVDFIRVALEMSCTIGI